MEPTASSPGRAFPGATVTRDDPRYPALVRGFNQRWVGHPAFVQVCGDADQVLRTVQDAIDRGLRITVRGGGHCYEDFVSGNDDGVIIDLSPLNAVYEQDRLFCIEGGCTLWNVYTQLYKEYGLTMPGGSCYSVGAGGHIIGGGYGLLSRKYGLTVDHLYAVELIYVTPERRAERIIVSRDSTDPDEQDLFWAHLGGGGGNLGIVTRYMFKELPPAPSMAWLASIAWEWDTLTQAQFAELVRKYGAFFEQNSAVDSPYKDLFALLHLTHKAAQQIVLTVQSVGGPRLIDDLIAQIGLAGVGHVAQRVPVGYHHMVPNADQVLEMPWLDVTQTLNGSGRNQRGKYKSAYMIRAFPSQQIDVMWQFLTTDGYANPQALLQVDSYGCQINALAPDATAVPQRSSVMKLQYQTYWTDRSQDEVNLRWIGDFYTAMYGPRGPYPDGTMDGCYVNYPDVDLVDWQYLYYKEGYPRLQRAKLRWDRNDIFHHAQSIELPRGADLGGKDRT